MNIFKFIFQHHSEQNYLQGIDFVDNSELNDAPLQNSK